MAEQISCPVCGKQAIDSYKDENSDGETVDVIVHIDQQGPNEVLVTACTNEAQSQVGGTSK